MPSRKHFVDVEIPKLFTEVKCKVLHCLSDHAEYFSATTDLWTSAANHPYLSFTVHFIDKDWKLQCFCLDTVPLFSDHTGQNIADAIQDILLNWNLEADNLITTTDNGSNFIAAFHNILEWPRLSCFGHNLDLAINKSLNVSRIQRVVGRCHSLLEVFGRSWKKTRDLRQKQQELNLKHHKLISDVATRWGSTYLMMERILEQQRAISSVLADDRKYWHKMLTDQDLSCLETIISVLRPIFHFTDALSGEKHVTISAVQPLLSHITNSLLASSEQDSTLAAHMKNTIASDLTARYSSEHISDVINICSYLDPRFRIDYISDKERILKQIEREGISVAEIHQDSESSRKEIPPPKKTKGLGAILKAALQPSSTQKDPQHRVQEEMTKYELLPSVEMDDDPIVWWKTNIKSFPILGTLARKYLCAYGTSVPSERLFSQAGYIINDLRARLTPEHVNQLVFLAKNMQLAS